MRDFSIDLVWAKIQMAITAIGGWLGYFVGGLDGLLITLIIFMVLDYVTGIFCAVMDKNLSSEVGFKGICKKVLILMLVGVANIVDVHVIGSGNALRGAVVCFYLSNEGLSLLENAAHIGLPIPEKLKNALSQLHNRQDKVPGIEGPAEPDEKGEPDDGSEPTEPDDKTEPDEQTGTTDETDTAEPSGPAEQTGKTDQSDTTDQSDGN